MPLLNPKDRPSCVTDEFELNSKLFAHIHHDARLKGSHLQGEVFTRTVHYIQKMLQFIIANPGIFSEEQQKEFSAAFLKLEKVLDTLTMNDASLQRTKKRLADEIDVKKVDTEIQNLASEILTRFKAKDCEEILIPGGWLNTKAQGPGGHGMVYKLMKKIDKEGKPYFVFLAYNTGAGIEHHLNFSGKEDHYIPVMAYELPGPPTTEIDDIQNFVAGLLRPQITPKLQQFDSEPNWIVEQTFKATKVYANCISHAAFLGGKKVDPRSYCNSTTKGQLSGTCAMRVLMPLLANELSGETFRHFLYQVRLQSTINHFRIQSKQKKLGDEMVQRQLQTAIDKLERTTLKFRYRKHNKKPILTEKQAEEALDLKTAIETELRKAALKSATRRHRLVTPIEPSKETSSFELTKYTAAATNIPTARKIEAYEDLPAFDKSKDPESLLKACLAAMQKNDASLYSEGIIRDFEEFMLSLPVTGKEAEEYWKSRKTELLNTLQAMLRIYGKHCYLRGGHPFAERGLASASALIIASHIAKARFRDDKNFEKWPMSDMIKTTLNEWIKKNPFSVSGDPRWDTRLHELREFYQESLENSETPKQFENKKISTDYYDLKLILRHELMEKLAYCNNDTDTAMAADIMDRARINFYRMANGIIPIPEDSHQDERSYKSLLEDFQFCNTFGELVTEHTRVAGSDFRYFRDADTSGVPKVFKVNCSRSYERRLGEYRTNFNFEHGFTFERPLPESLGELENIRNPMIREAMLPTRIVPPTDRKNREREGLAESNVSFLALADMDKSLGLELATGFPKYSAPFTRITMDPCRILATRRSFGI